MAESSLVEDIARRTGRRVRGMVVSHSHDRLTVRSVADSYYAWQLVIASCHAFLSHRPDVKLDCRIVVEGARCASSN